MSAREKGTLTKDSVSLLPCFYFVEVGDASHSEPLCITTPHSEDVV